MSATTADDVDAVVSRLVGDAEERYRREHGPRARAVVAMEAGVAPGTLENIKRGRHKGLRGRVRDKILGFVAGEIQREMQRLEHDLAMAVRCAARPDAPEILAARAALDTARRLIDRI